MYLSGVGSGLKMLTPWNTLNKSQGRRACCAQMPSCLVRQSPPAAGAGRLHPLGLCSAFRCEAYKRLQTMSSSPCADFMDITMLWM